jgi:glycosyltransferase involved in cell wall biosynthesis
MKILFDFQTFYFQEYGGISVYFSELINGLMQKENYSVICSIKYSSNINLKKLNFFKFKPSINSDSLFSNKNFPYKKRIFQILRYLKIVPNSYNENKKNSIKDLIKSNFDIFHPTYYDGYYINLIQKINKPFVLTVYDLIHEKYPGYFSIDDLVFKNRETLLNNANAIITISESTKKDLIKFYNIPHEKIKTIYLSSTLDKIQNTQKFVPSFLNNYLLFVGNRGGYKNFKKLLIAFSFLKKDNNLIKIVSLGSSPFNKSEIELMESLDILDKVIYIPFQSENQLKDFYEKALAFIFPSLYEGFGIPILEAFDSNCPVICSRTSSFPEVAGEAAIYFDPESPESIYSSIKNFLLNEKIKDNLVKKSYIQRKKFSWITTIDSTIDLYESLKK